MTEIVVGVSVAVNEYIVARFESLLKQMKDEVRFQIGYWEESTSDIKCFKQVKLNTPPGPPQKGKKGKLKRW